MEYTSIGKYKCAKHRLSSPVQSAIILYDNQQEFNGNHSKMIFDDIVHRFYGN